MPLSSGLKKACTERKTFKGNGRIVDRYRGRVDVTNQEEEEEEKKDLPAGLTQTRGVQRRGIGG